MKCNCCKNGKIDKKLESAIDFLKAISEPNRLKILCLLKRKKVCVCEIGEHLKLPQNLVSHHLAVLRKNNIVLMEKFGLKVFYKVNQRVVKNNLKVLSEFLLKKYDN